MVLSKTAYLKVENSAQITFKGGSITVPLTSYLTGLKSAVQQLTIFVFIFPPLEFPYASVFLVPIDRVTERFSRQKVFDVFLETFGDVRRKTDSGDVRRHGDARVRPEVERGHLLLVECSDIPLLHLTGTII